MRTKYAPTGPRQDARCVLVRSLQSKPMIGAYLVRTKTHLHAPTHRKGRIKMLRKKDTSVHMFAQISKEVLHFLQAPAAKVAI